MSAKICYIVKKLAIVLTVLFISRLYLIILLFKFCFYLLR